MDHQEFITKADAWDVAEAVDLLLGMRPLRSDEPDRSKDLRELAYRAIDAGVLPCVGKRKHRRVTPVEFAKWAITKGCEIPVSWKTAQLVHAMLPEPEPTAAEAPIVQSDAPLSEAERAKSRAMRKRITRIRIAGETARRALIKRLGREPSADEFFSYLADEDETGIIVDQKPDALVWVDTRGTFHETRRKTLGSMLSNIRAR